MSKKKSRRQAELIQGDSDVPSENLEPKIIKDTSPYVPQRDKINFNLNIAELPWTEKQKAFIELVHHKDTKIVFLSGPAGTSKAQPLDADILTPSGWVKMGNIKPGDYVFGRNGKPTKVLNIYPQGVKEIFKITFSDGATTECTEDHLWLTKTYYDRTFLKTKETVRLSRLQRGLPNLKHSEKRINSAINGTVKTLKEIKETLYVGESKNINHTIPITEPVQFEPVEHIIHPYIMGALLGDGCLRTHVGFACADTGILEQIKSFLPEDVHLKYNNKQYSYSFIGEKQNNIFLNEIRRLNLDGKYSYNKSIPNEYLFDSPDNRLWLLKGLMDTDGFVVKKQGNMGFSSTSKQLINDVRFLVESLGGICSKGTTHQGNTYMYNEELRKGRESYSFFINMPIVPFNLERKKDAVKTRTKYFPTRYIVDVESVSYKEAQCILVEDQDHLYLTNNCIVTHNTVLAVYTALKLLNEKKVSELIYIRSIIESASKSLGSLPGEADDKFRPFAAPLLDKLEELLRPADVKRLLLDNRVKPVPVNYLRGASYNVNFVIADEMQNAEFSEIQTIITRIGHFSKFVFCGDPMQTDLKEKHRSGFKQMFDLFNCEESQKEGIYCIEFGKEDIMRSGILKYIIEKLEEVKNVTLPHK